MPPIVMHMSRDVEITEADLEWWLELAPRLEWIWARTYAESAPHWYVVLDRTPGLERDDFVRAARVIRAFGQPDTFWSRTYVYLTDEKTGMKWWTMDDPVETTGLINMAEVQPSR